MKKLLILLLLATYIQADTSKKTLDKTGEAAQEMLDITSNIKEDANRVIRVSINTMPSYLNQSVDNSQAEALINDGSSHYEFAVLFRANKSDPLNLTKSTHAYFSLHIMSYVNSGVEDGYGWADYTDSMAIVYGYRYYANDNYTGVGYGWYAGLSSWENSDAYYWNSADGSAFVDYTDNGINALVAGELFYTYEYENFFATPRVIISIDTENMEFIFAPQLMIGVQF